MTLIEILIVVLIMGLISAIVGYNFKGALDKGKAFCSEQGARKLEDILNMEIQLGNGNPSDFVNTHNRDQSRNIIRAIENSGLVPGKQIPSLIVDGWKQPYKIDSLPGQNGVTVTSEKYEQYVRDHGFNSKNGEN